MHVQYVPKRSLIPAVLTIIERFTEKKSQFLPRLLLQGHRIRKAAPVTIKVDKWYTSHFIANQMIFRRVFFVQISSFGNGQYHPFRISITALVAQLVKTVDLKSRLLSSGANALSHSVLEPNFPSKQNTHFSALLCTVLTRRMKLFLSLSII